MITGYNTDVEYDGVVYHVQTEDKGLQAPIILSLVYVGGEILASKRTPYSDLVGQEFDEEVLVKRLQRQHKLICAAVHAGRIEDLKRMTERDSAPVTKPAQDAAAQRFESDQQSGEQTEPQSSDQFSSSEAAADDEGLVVRLIAEQELRGGQTVNLRFLVTRTGRAGREPAPEVPVVVKTLGSTFAPQKAFSTTDERGVAAISISLPDFTAGRAALLVQAECDGETAELRRIIFPSKS